MTEKTERIVKPEARPILKTKEQEPKTTRQEQKPHDPVVSLYHLQTIIKEFPERPILGADIIKFLEFNWFPKYEQALKKLKALANATI